MGAVRTGLSLDPKLRELAICAVAVLNRADYELVQHAPEWLQVGGTQSQLDRLADVDAAAQDETLFDAAERATLALTIAMTRNVQVSDTCFAQLQSVLPTPQSQVELAGVIAAYNMVSRFLEALQVAPE
jgi:alkylhydroperoxidase family enzyme